MADGYPAHGSVSETKLNIPAQGYQQNCQAMNSTDEENMKNSSKSDDIIIKLYDIYIYIYIYKLYIYETSVPEKKKTVEFTMIESQLFMKMFPAR